MFNPRPLTLALIGSILAAGLSLTSAVAEDEGEGGQTEVLMSLTDLIVDAIDPSEVPLENVFIDALYSTGGTSLRNQSEGGISLSGGSAPPPPAIAAFAYWAVITNGPYVPGLHDQVILRKKDPKKSRNAKLTGSVVGVGPDPCWPPGTTITVFKAPIPLKVINAGGGHAGVFEVRLNCAGAGSCLGEDPWNSAPQLPLWEGASIVAIWEAPGWTTSIHDVGLAATTFLAKPGLTYTLAIPPPGVGNVLFDNIGADGQRVRFLGSRTAIPSLGDERTTITPLPVGAPVPIAGPVTPYNDSDWNGNDSNPLPSLWDTTGHAFTVLPGTTALTVSIASFGGGFPTDCLTPVANVVATQ